MKNLLTLFMIFSAEYSLHASELDKISLITPMPYEKNSSSSQTTTSKLKVAIGSLINIDVAEEVKKKIGPYRADLSGYFQKPGELDEFVNKVVSEGKDSIIGDKLTDQKLIRFYEYLGNKLIGGIADKILSTEGVTDPSRRELWLQKMLTPFKTCINNSQNSQYDASHCMDALTSSLVPNTGVGLVYELSRANLGSTLPENKRELFYSEQTNLYKVCMKKHAGLASDVKGCALDAMKSGVLKITDSKLSKTINEAASSSMAAKNIKQTIWPEFTACSSKVGSNKNSHEGLSEQFMSCIDDLVKSTGSQLVQDKLSTTAAIRANFNKSDAAKIIAEKVQDFKACTEDQKKNNKRKDGMIDTSKCENYITNDITYKVVLKTLNSTATDAFKNDAKKSLELGNTGKHLLDQCWNNDQGAKEREACLRKTILQYSQTIAAVKLDQSIPNDITIKKELTSAGLKDLANCFEKQLPANISEAKNLSALTAVCTNKLTHKIAEEVARESVRAKCEDMKLSLGETEILLKKFVDQNFALCIGTAPTDEKLESCSGELKKGVAMNLAAFQIRANAAGKVDADETNTLINTLVNHKFSECVGLRPNDKTLNACVGELTKAATKSIVLSYEKKQIKEQLNADVTPQKLKLVESQFINCVNNVPAAGEVASSIDECTKLFSLDFAKTLGELKLTDLMKSVLGTQSYNEQKASIDGILEKYNSCLDDLKSLKMQEGLLDKLTLCTDSLQKRGINFVSSTVNTWMSTEEKDTATIMVKNEFAKLLPCLGGLMPAAPYSQIVQQNADSVLKPVAQLLAQYIEYSPENAKRTLDEILKKLSTDLKDVASNPASKKELIKTLYQNGALDQFLKSMVRGEVKKALDSAPETDVPATLRISLLKKENFDALFSTPQGLSLKDKVMEKILEPILMDQASMSSPLIIAGMTAIKDEVTKMLVYSPNFGDQIIKTGVQGKMDELNAPTRMVAKIFFGKDSLNWDKVRLTPEGQTAETYIKENILMPKFKGEVLSVAQEKKTMKEATDLVEKAVKKHE